MKIILYGPPGAGKTTIGQSLAEKLNLPFFDSDELIENKEGRTISEIFLESGEPYFRNQESQVVNELLKEPAAVISLGGGAVVSPENFAKLQEAQAWKIYLTISAQVAATRIGFNKARPLLTLNPRQQWNALFNARKEIYEKLADLQISNESSPNETVSFIISQIERDGEK